jgi:hypothetical protein
MAESLKTRLLALERGHVGDRPTCGVVTFGRNETPEEAMLRAKLGGMTGPVLLVPEVMTYDEWTEMMKEVTRLANE